MHARHLEGWISANNAIFEDVVDHFPLYDEHKLLHSADLK